MAEQIRHNVVNGPESASASAPADGASTFNPADTAAPGTPNEYPDHLAHSKNANSLATDANATPSSPPPDAAAGTDAAHPSAGNATESAAAAAHEKDIPASSDALNEAHDHAPHGEALLEDGRSVTPDVSVDHSVQSDTDVSRGDASENSKDKHHTRTNSVKKPTTFSKVSVTKTFLAKSVTPVPAATKIGEKPAPVAAAAAPMVKPRLVAKSGSGLQNMQKVRIGVESVGGPDASKVWNKNRPVAPAPPKHLTDEELKQQYGIHLATRLQSDENGKDSKWADIDDDEDDWAPDAVVWMDGTKSTLAPAETAPEPEQKQAPPQPAKPAEPTKPNLSGLLKKSVDTGPPKTILKPGIAAQQTKQQNGTSSSASGAERPSLKAKSPAPAPVKSPWAPVAPVAAISPINPPVQPPPPQPTQMASQDARAYEVQPPYAPAREIAADTFDRSWREGEGGSRELFNSANGRYEPAPEGRRSSVKPDSAFRKPAVLQRPSQMAAAAAPAEPSATFQQRNSSQMDGAAWPRRRGSSISQGSSLPPGRRTSVSSRGPEHGVSPERRGSTVVSQDARAAPHAANGDPDRPTFSQQSPWDQQMPSMPAPAADAAPVAHVPDAEDPVKIQERVMKEKRELAKKRRLEEEQRMEKEKQERLKARLAALEGAGKSRKEREAEAAAPSPTPTIEKPVRPSPATAPAESPPAVSSEPAEALKIEAPTPSSTAEPAHASQAPAAEEKLPSNLPPKPQPPAAAPTTERSDANQRQAPRPHLSPRANARTPFSQQPSQYRQQASSYSSPGDRKTQPFGRSPLTGNDTFSSWATSGSGANVWGSSGIGNGTFEKSNSFAPLQQNSTLPPPPGMNRIPPQSFTQESRSPSLQHQQLADHQRTFAPPGVEQRQENTWGQSRANGVSPAPSFGFGRQTNLPAPIGPPSRAHQQPASHAADKWNKASQDLPTQYSAEAAAASADQQSKDVNAPPPPPDTIKETFKQTTSSARLGGPRRYARPEYTIHDTEGSRQVSTLSPAPPNAQTQPPGPFSTTSPQDDPWKPDEKTVRLPDGSRNPAHGGLSVQQPPIAPPVSQSHSALAYQGTTYPDGSLDPTRENGDQSPPPPEVSSHPVNSGDSTHPTVRLPPPPPVVKLPPAIVSPLPQQSAVIMPPGPRPPQNYGPVGAARPIVMNEAWQARFNGLFNRAPIQTEVPPSPPKTPPKSQDPVLAVASSSKTQLDNPASRFSATVSLPLAKRLITAEGFVVDDSTDITSKPAIDHMFNEELSFGSKPSVRVPRNPKYNTAVYNHKPQYNMLKFQSNSKLQKAIDAQSKAQLDILDVMFKHHLGYFLNIPRTKLRNKMVKHTTPQPQQPRKTSGFQERKTSRKLLKGKDKEGGADAPAANALSRTVSAQKNRPPASSPPAATGSEVHGENVHSKKKSTWVKSKARNPPPTTTKS